MPKFTLTDPNNIGIIVATDFPAELRGDLEARKVKPVELTFVYKDRSKAPFALPVRKLNAVEVIAVFHRGLADGQVEVAVLPKGQGPRPNFVEGV